MGGFRTFLGRLVVEGKAETPRTAERWQERRGTIWADGYRLANGRVGTEVVEAHTPPLGQLQA